jgi:hypothetical protein
MKGSQVRSAWELCKSGTRPVGYDVIDWVFDFRDQVTTHQR